MNRDAMVRDRSRRGFLLLEALLAVMIMGIFLVALIVIQSKAIREFAVAGDYQTASWLAELKMAELISQDLPDPEDEETWWLSDEGDFGEFDERVNDFNRRYNDDWTERDSFSRFTYRWEKELLFVGADFLGGQEDLDAWEPAVDEYGQPTEDETDNPSDKPAARVVRITLEVFLPLRRGVDEEGVEESEESYQSRSTIRLVTWVDPALLYAAEEEEEPADEGSPAPTGGSGNGGGTGGGG